MKSLKIDLRGASEEEKWDAIQRLHSLGYVGNPYPSNFYFYCIYATDHNSKYYNQLSFGNNMKTFSINKGKEITLKELEITCNQKEEAEK